MSEPFPSRVPEADFVLLELKRSDSTVRVSLLRWPGGRSGVAISYIPSSKAAKHVNVASHEVRRVAAAILAAADKEGW